VSSELRRHHPRIAYWWATRCRLATLVAMAVGVGAATACGGSIPSPTSELDSGQAVMDLGTLVGELREKNFMMQAQIASLKGLLAYQDTIRPQPAAGAGVPMRSPMLPTP